MPSPNSNEQSSALSYKFERLREKLRKAIQTGEISGKLPGERLLADKYHVNAKTLSKALTDLAAEGLLERSIGRGTFVKGHEPARSEGRWLILCDESQVNGEFVTMMKQARPDVEVITDVTNIRPSFLGNFDAVIDVSLSTPPEFLRQLAVRKPAGSIDRQAAADVLHACGTVRRPNGRFAGSARPDHGRSQPAGRDRIAGQRYRRFHAQ